MCVALLLRIQVLPGSDLGLETSNSVDSCEIPQPPPPHTNVGNYVTTVSFYIANSPLTIHSITRHYMGLVRGSESVGM
jgi:hypothetical protein